MHIVYAQEILVERKKERKEEGREEESRFSVSWSVNIYISFIFVFTPLPEEINEGCELPKEASLSELTYVQRELN